MTHIPPRIALCQVGERSWGVDLNAILGIQSHHFIQWHLQPDSPQVGQIATKGLTIPVYSVARLIDTSEDIETANRRGQCLVVDDGQSIFGLWVDRTQPLRSTQNLRLSPLPDLATGTGSNRFLGALCSPDNDTSPLLVLRVEGLSPHQPDPPTATTTVERITPRREAVSRPQLLTFSCGAGTALRLAFTLSQVDEILRVPSWEPIPWSPQSVLGIASYRGTPLPLIQFEELGQQALSSSSRVAVVRIPECPTPVGVIVHSECQLLEYPGSAEPVSLSEVPLPPHLIRAVFRVPGETLVFPRFQL